jgi:dihydrofolate reductase
MQDKNGVIGVNGKLPFHLPKDMKRFKELTTGHIVVMGRKTWDSIPDNYKPLKDRDNYVLSHNTQLQANGFTILNNFTQIQKLCEDNPDRQIFIIGGSELYKYLIRYAAVIYITQVFDNAKTLEGDLVAFAPHIENYFNRLCKDNIDKTPIYIDELKTVYDPNKDRIIKVGKDDEFTVGMSSISCIEDNSYTTAYIKLIRNSIHTLDLY